MTARTPEGARPPIQLSSKKGLAFSALVELTDEERRARLVLVLPGLFPVCGARYHLRLQPR